MRWGTCHWRWPRRRAIWPETGIPGRGVPGAAGRAGGRDAGPRPAGHTRGPLTAVTRLALDRLRDRDPAAAELAALCAFLAPEPMPADLFTVAAGELPATLADRGGGPASPGIRPWPGSGSTRWPGSTSAGCRCTG